MGYQAMNNQTTMAMRCKREVAKFFCSFIHSSSIIHRGTEYIGNDTNKETLNWNCTHSLTLVLFLAKREREISPTSNVTHIPPSSVNGFPFLQRCSICQSVLWATGPRPAINPAHHALLLSVEG